MHERIGRLGAGAMALGVLALINGCGGDASSTVVTHRVAGALSAAPSPSKGSGLVWQLPSGEVRLWDMASGTDAKELSLGQGSDPNVWKIVATGSFGLLYPGLLWSDARDGLLSEWHLSDTTVFEQTSPTHNAPVSMQNVQGTPEPFAATAYPIDIDGDFVTDVVWRELSMTITSGPYGSPQITTDNIRSEEWMLLGGQTVPKYDAYLDSPTMSVAAAGDFDGSGYGDILFHDSSSGDTEIVFSPGYWWDYGPIPLEWSIMGSGDFNNDGADDILWYDTSTGDVVIWYMEPGTGAILGGYWIDNVDINSGWVIDGVADTNHDDVSDIIWEHSTGLISIWTMNPDATVSDYGAPLTKPAGATFAGVLPLGPAPATSDEGIVSEQVNGDEVDALVEFEGHAARPDDYIEIWTDPNGANLGKVQTFPIASPSGNTLGAWVNTAWLPGGTTGCFVMRAWEQGRTSTFSRQLCLPGLGSPLRGHVDFANQNDNNRCVPDPAHVLNRLNANGELLAWNYSSTGYTPLDSNEYHTETIVRMPYLAGTSLDGSIFAATFSHEKCDNPNVIGDCGAHLGVAKFGFTGGRSGGVLGTNRGFYGGGTSAPDWGTTPNPGFPNDPSAGDGFLPIGSPSTSHFNLSLSNTVENHPSGASALGQYLAVPIQGYDTGCSGFLDLYSCNPPQSRGIVQIWDMTAPLNPALRSAFTTYTDINAINSSGSGKDVVAVAITKLNDGRFLMAVNTNTPKSQMEFYFSSGTSLNDPNVFGAPNRAPDAVSPAGRTPHSIWDLRQSLPNWQNFNFLTGCDGSLWLIGSRDEDDDTRYPGPDSIDLYQLTIGGASNTEILLKLPSDQYLTADAVSSKSMNCSDNGGALQCTLAAGGGAYVDPDGNLIYYATNYDNDGFQSGNAHGNGVNGMNTGTYASTGGFIRGKEFHERHGNNGANTACSTLDSAWVEFYSQKTFNNNGTDSSGQIFYQNYATRNLRNPDFGANYFAQKAQSVRWCLPQGTSYQVRNANGSTGYLTGAGVVMGIADLSQESYPYGGSVSANQSIRYGYFISGYSDPAGWPGIRDDSN
jgi:hypothetical protein